MVGLFGFLKNNVFQIGMDKEEPDPTQPCLKRIRPKRSGGKRHCVLVESRRKHLPKKSPDPDPGITEHTVLIRIIHLTVLAEQACCDTPYRKSCITAPGQQNFDE